MINIWKDCDTIAEVREYGLCGFFLEGRLFDTVLKVDDRSICCQPGTINQTRRLYSAAHACRALGYGSGVGCGVPNGLKEDPMRNAWKFPDITRGVD
jgi:hypothetical protein